MLIRQFITDHTVYRLVLVYALVLLLLDIGGGDIWFASKIYAWEGYEWSLQQHWLAEDILHKGARKLNYLFCSAILTMTVYYLLHYRRFPAAACNYIALSLSLICSFTLVAYLKAITNTACPWDLTMFGGTEPYIHLLEHRPSYLPYNQCFPAGHASVGYAWLALFYFFKQHAPRWRFWGLGFGLVSGLILGITQQLRGAHFLSHDITTLVLCLLCAKLCFMLVNTLTKETAITGSL